MRFLKFFLTNVSGTVVDTIALLALSKVFGSFVTLYLVAPVLAFEAAVLNNYTIAYFWIWGDRVERNWPDFARRLGDYHANALGVFLGRLALIAILGRWIGLDVVLCNLLALLVSGLFNFGSQDRVIFGSGSRRRRSIGVNPPAAAAPAG